MMTNMEMKFNSQICTSREQSRRLLALGLKPDTADMSSDGWNDPVVSWGVEWSKEIIESGRLPAWSLHRLIEMMPQYLYITRDKEEFYLYINNDGVMYNGVAMKLALVEFVECGNLYDNIIGCIAYLIKEGYFNKEYLV